MVLGRLVTVECVALGCKTVQEHVRIQGLQMVGQIVWGMALNIEYVTWERAHSLDVPVCPI